MAKIIFSLVRKMARSSHYSSNIRGRDSGREVNHKEDNMGMGDSSNKVGSNVVFNITILIRLMHHPIMDPLNLIHPMDIHPFIKGTVKFITKGIPKFIKGMEDITQQEDIIIIILILMDTIMEYILPIHNNMVAVDTILILILIKDMEIITIHNNNNNNIITLIITFIMGVDIKITITISSIITTHTTIIIPIGIPMFLVGDTNNIHSNTRSSSRLIYNRHRPPCRHLLIPNSLIRNPQTSILFIPSTVVTHHLIHTMEVLKVQQVQVLVEEAAQKWEDHHHHHLILMHSRIILMQGHILQGHIITE